MDAANDSARIDPAWIAAIAREVIARLKASNLTQTITSTPTASTTAASIADKVITTDSLRNVATTTTQLFIGKDAIVTPAAKDEAKERGISINRSVQLPAGQEPNGQKLEITDSQQLDRADAIKSQLKRRGLKDLGGRIVLSDTPSRDVVQCCGAGQRAVMVTSVADVRRFADELNPDTWVLDMKRMNLVTATNAAAQITQLRPTK
jgi:hypothetical protein